MEDISKKPVLIYGEISEEQKSELSFSPDSEKVEKSDPFFEDQGWGSNDKMEIIYPERALRLTTKHGYFDVKSGDIVGREGIGTDILDHFSTVSRAHAQFFYRDGKWYINNFSTNFSYLKNDPLCRYIRVGVNEECEIMRDDILYFSGKCELKVEEIDI
jgi:hypothetical protein